MGNMSSYLLFGLALTAFHSKADLQKTLGESLNAEVTPTWNVLREYAKKSFDLDAHKTICVGIIKLQPKNPLKLTSFELNWSGPHVNKVYASLYRKHKHTDTFTPLSSNHVCDGQWDETKQQITFPLKEKVVATQHYYLVLGTKNEQENSLKSGSFTLITSTKKLLQKLHHLSSSA